MFRYSHYEKLLAGLAWQYSEASGFQFEELFSVAKESFVKASRSYDPDKSKKSTWIFNVANQQIRNWILIETRKFLSRFNVYDTLPDSLEPIAPDTSIQFKEKYWSLNKEAQEIVDWIISDTQFWAQYTTLKDDHIHLFTFQKILKEYMNIDRETSKEIYTEIQQTFTSN